MEYRSVIQLTNQFIETCPIEKGFRLRGCEMTRIEVFVDAAFAFAVTMLVISFDSIPDSYEKMMLAIKSIPAFLLAVAQLMWIWHTHNTWSKRYGLDDTITVVLSTLLLSVILIYIYPMRVMLQGMFAWMTSGFLPSGFQQITLLELSDMFVFLGLGFVALCLIFVFMYRYAYQKAEILLLNQYELHETRTLEIIWKGCAVIGLLMAITAKVVPTSFIPFSGFVLMLLSIYIPVIRIQRNKNSPVIEE